MSNRWWLPFVLVAAWAPMTGRSSAEDHAFLTYFAEAADDALVRKIELRTDAASSPESSRVRHRYHWEPKLGGLLVQSELAANKLPSGQGTSLPVFDLSVRLRHHEEDASYERLTYRASEWYGSTFWTGPDWTRVGRDWHHPGENTPSVRSFRAPHAGRATVTGRVYKLHEDGDGVRLSIHLNDTELWRAEIDGKDGQGVEPNLAVELRRDDRLRFRVHKRGKIFCDTTHWDPVVTYEDGSLYQASKSFAAKRQGEGHWYYEQWVERRPDAPAPTVYSFDRSWAQREFPVTAKTLLKQTHQEALPCLVVADGTGDSGVLLVTDSTGPWTWNAAMTNDGSLRIWLETDISPVTDSDEGAGLPRDLPTVLVASYEGPWTASFSILEKLTRAGKGGALVTAHHQATDGLQNAPELALLLMAQADWHMEDQRPQTVKTLRDAIEQHLLRAEDLLATVRQEKGRASGEHEAAELRELLAAARAESVPLDELRRTYLRTRLLKRDFLLGNPQLDFDSLLFCKRKPPGYSHLVGQYYGWRQRPGGGLYELQKPGISLACRDVLQGQLPPGNLLEPRLSYDGRRILFSFVACPETQLAPEQLSVNEDGQDVGYFHIYEINTDGSGLRQLTHGAYDDMMPVYLPDGGIAFTSTRRRSYSRCFGAQFSDRWDSYTLHRMDRSGENLRILSLNDVSEWFPAVSNSGHLLFARWDYIDRDAVTHQNLWSMRPDGTNPSAVWGNATPAPHCTFQAKPVPASQKIVFIASAHHAITAGPVCLVDPTVDANGQEAITRITPEPYPEVESRDIPEYYCSPWPLSENLFLVAYSRDRLQFEGEHMRDPNPDNALGIYLLDAAGNRELIYRDPRIGSTNPMPLVPQPVPPVLTNLVAEKNHPTGEMIVTNVYEGLGEVPRGTIKALRIVQIFPKTTPLANNPRIGLAGEENGRAILGTVPVEPDGSARFLLPAHKPVLFQALDENGFAYQTMRSTTYVQPGEQTACVGCHEHRMSSPPADARMPLALRRPPSNIDRGELGGRPFSYTEVVQPVLNRHCVRCHGGDKVEGDIDLTGTPHDGFSKSYWSLCGQDTDWRKRVANLDTIQRDLVPRYWMRNRIQQTAPGGRVGALGSQLMKLLRSGHEDVTMGDDDLRRIAVWIDLNAIFYGVYGAEDQARQLRGELVAMPEIQ